MEDNKYFTEITRGRSVINDSIFDYLLKNIEGKLLDIGCNSGALLEEYSGVGVDLSRSLVQKAKSKGLEVYHAGAYKLPFKDLEFDTAVLSCVLEQVEEPYIAIKEALRVSKKVLGVTPIPLRSQWGFKGGWVKSVIAPEDLKKKFKAKIDYFSKTHYGFTIKP